MAKKLSLSEINKLSGQFNEKKEITLEVNSINSKGEIQEYKCQISTKFKRTDIQKMLIDYMAILEEFKQRKNISTEDLYDTTTIMYGLIVSYFTNIQIPKIDKLEQLIHVTENLINLGIIEQLFKSDKGFDPDEVKFLNQEMEKAAKQIGENLGELAVRGMVNEQVNGVEEDAPIQ
jgi:hypothetical protein